MCPDAVVNRARALLGVRFRPQGRSRAQGLDCIGLVAEALGVACVRRDYALRSGDEEVLARELARAGLVRGDGPRRGDVLVMSPGPAQLHLGIWTGDALVHADAALAQVVERPGAPPWVVIGCWRRDASQRADGAHLPLISQGEA